MHSAPLKDQLLNIEAEEPRRPAGGFDLKQCGNLLRLLLNRLPALDMKLVIEAWEHRVRQDALFAVLILNWRSKSRDLPESLLLAAIEGLSHRAIYDRELLHSMVSWCPSLVERVPILAQQVCKEREEEAREIRIREESRRNLIQSVDHQTPADRLRWLLSCQPSVVYSLFSNPKDNQTKFDGVLSASDNVTPLVGNAACFQPPRDLPQTPSIAPKRLHAGDDLMLVVVQRERPLVVSQVKPERYVRVPLPIYRIRFS